MLCEELTEMIQKISLEASTKIKNYRLNNQLVVYTRKNSRNRDNWRIYRSQAWWEFRHASRIASMLQTELGWIVVPFMKLGNIRRGLDKAK